METFFDIQEELLANSILSHFNFNNIEEKVFYFDVGIVEKLIGDLLFDIKRKRWWWYKFGLSGTGIVMFKKKAEKEMQQLKVTT